MPEPPARRADDHPSLVQRLTSIEGQNAAILIGLALAMFSSGSLQTSPAWAVMQRNGGAAWIWAALALGILKIVAMVRDTLWLRVVAAFGAFMLFGLTAIMIALARGLDSPGVAIFAPLAVFALLSFVRRGTRSGGRHA